MAHGDAIRSAKRISPLGYFALGVDTVRVCSEGSERLFLAVANGSDWSPQPLTLHQPSADGLWESGPCWFSDDYDHHTGIAVGDLTGNGFADVVVAVFCGRNQDLCGGGIKIYLGGPHGLSPVPKWLARGFAATGIALGDLNGTGSLDILVSVLWEAGTVQSPLPDPSRPDGKARLLINTTKPGQEGLQFDECIVTARHTQGCGAVAIADVNRDGVLDAIFGGSRTTVLFGPPGWGMTAEAVSPAKVIPWDATESWTSREEHPFCFSVCAFSHPAAPESLLIASSRGLFSLEQLGARSLDEISPGVLIHAPAQRTQDSRDALQVLAPFQLDQPEVPAGLACFATPEGMPQLAVGALEATGGPVQGAPVRIYAGQPTRNQPFEPVGTELPGASLMAGHLHATQVTPTSANEREIRHVVASDEFCALTLEHGDQVIEASVSRLDTASMAFCRPPEQGPRITQTSDARTLCFSPPLRAGDIITLSLMDRGPTNLIAASSAAWPPAGASAAWRVA